MTTAYTVTVDYRHGTPHIVDRVPLLSPLHDENAAYLKAKQVIMGHMLGLTA